MAILKCKMCGGDVELMGDKTFGTCEYCGCTMTFPKVDDDARAAAFNRGNHFRRIGEFDKALAVYERIVQEDNTDAEAHWCCALCRFGIEYVEDPATMEWLPTCHRASFDSFLEDVDYLAAVEHSDGITRRQYQKDAAKIADVQRGILATSQNAEPYDVFICYKETDEHGGRTKDSMLAQDIYYQLTEQGRKVFFARITLEDVAGAQYEPYIFAALNSAKVMIVVGTTTAHLNAVWVKNEWSRFLSLMKKDHSKLLLPCYRDMDPYDLPEQLSVLQSYDMAKIGFIQDLIRGVAKVLDSNKKVTSTVVKETVITGAPANTAPLLKRAFMFLEDGDWDSADEYCEKVLDLDPECAEAYLGKLMVELEVTSRQNLKNCPTPFERSNNFQKAMRFADENLKKELQGYIDFIVNRNFTNAYNDAVHAMQSASTEEEYKKAAAKFQKIHSFKDSKELAQECLAKAEEARLTVLYNTALSAMNSADTEQQYKSAAGKFNAIKDFRDAEDKAKLCLEKAEVARKDAIYDAAIASMKAATIPAYKKAIDAFKTIEDWKDSASQIYDCERIIYEIEQKEKAARTEAARLAEEKRLEQERIAEERRVEQERIRKENEERARRNRRIATIILSLIAVVVIFLVVLFKLIIPENNYSKATELMANGNYLEASKIYKNLGNYKDSADKSIEAMYQQGLVYWNAKQFDDSNKIFEGIITYKDSKEKIHTHEYASKVTQAPSCAKEGVTTFSCKTCDSEYTEPIKLLAHTYEEKVTLKPTCTVIGKKTLTCKSCKQIKEETIQATGHSYKEKITKAATCESSGTKTLSCHCGDTRNETIKATGHNYSAATCTSPKKCKTCGATSGNALGHNYSAATCTSPKKCKTCGATSGNALGHTKDSTKCNRCGSKSFTALKYSSSNGVYQKYQNLYFPAGNYKITVKATLNKQSTGTGYFDRNPEMDVQLFSDEYKKERPYTNGQFARVYRDLTLGKEVTFSDTFYLSNPISQVFFNVGVYGENHDATWTVIIEAVY